jgi:hypothetical protein
MTTNIDPAAVKAAHTHHAPGPTSATPCAKLPERRWGEVHEHCLPWLLADALLTERAKVAQVRALANRLDARSMGLRAMVTRSPAVATADGIRAALADQPEQAS